MVTLASPGVVSDCNGFFRPVGDHAQTQFSIDNQPVTDQQRRLYSNQISPDAVQSMEIITVIAPDELGDKNSAVHGEIRLAISVHGTASALLDPIGAEE